MLLSPEDQAILLAFERLAAQTQGTGRLFDLALELAVRTTQAERAFLVRLAPDRGLVFQASRNFDREEVRRPALKVSTSLIRAAADAAETIRTDEAVEDPRFESAQSIQDLDLRSVLVVPVRYESRVAGVLYLDNRFVRGLFGPRQEALVQAMADRLGEPLVLAAQREAVRTTLDRLMEDGKGPSPTPGFGRLVGLSAPMQRAYEVLRAAASSEAPLLITGESGTGKELAARAVHFQGLRKDRPFVAESCAALPDTLLESELFGHAKGAFTGADRDKAGLFELAHGGTLFLDEIGEASPAVQKKLLRALEEGAVRPLGAERPRPVDVRLVFATNRDLDRARTEGDFLPDLYYRIAVLHVRMPALRERMEDLEPLAASLLEASGAMLMPDALRCLRGHAWPGNVRELANVLERARILSDGGDIAAEHIVLDPARGSAVPMDLAVPASVSEIRNRQARFLTGLGMADVVVSQDYADRVDVSKRTAIRDLNELVDLGVLERLGERRASRYRRRG